MTLTEQERKKLLHQCSMPEHIHWWSRTVALDPNPTPQQIETAKQLLALNSYQRQQHWIFQDTLRHKPKVTPLRVKKSHS